MSEEDQDAPSLECRFEQVVDALRAYEKAPIDWVISAWHAHQAKRQADALERIAEAVEGLEAVVMVSSGAAKVEGVLGSFASVEIIEGKRREGDD